MTFLYSRRSASLLLVAFCAFHPTAQAQSVAAPPAPAARGPVVVSGVVPNEATRQSIIARVREVYGRDQVIDQLGVADASAPPGWADNVNKLITADLKGVQRGHLKVSGSTVELVGEADSATRDKLSGHLSASLNPTYTIQNRLLVNAAPQARIDSLLDGKVVEFELGSNVLSPVGRSVLDELLPVLKNLNGKRLQIIGHTDDSGQRMANVLLSRQRALAVKTYLVEKSLPAATILTDGVGPDRPVMSNQSPEGQARNRRIEFKVLP